MATLPHATLALRPSRARGHADHGWLNTYHTFSFASYHDPRYMSFGALRVLNEDRVSPQNGFPTHPHRDAEIFSYILSGELTHRDSMVRDTSPSATTKGDDFFTMKRGDLQFTTGGTGIAHSEYNQHSSTPVHFLQIWVTPWSRGLPPIYHTATFTDAAKRAGFVTLLSPLAAGRGASAAQEREAVPRLPGTVPIHADFVMGAALVPPQTPGGFEWVVGGVSKDGGEPVVEKKEGRKVFVHLPMTKDGAAKVRVAGREDGVLGEGDGLFVTGVKAGDKLSVECLGDVEAEVVVLDSD